MRMKFKDEIFSIISNAYSRNDLFYRTSVLVSRTESKYSLNVPSQFIELRPFYGAKGNCGIESLLEDVTDNQIDDAINLVNGKVIYQISYYFMIFY